MMPGGHNIGLSLAINFDNQAMTKVISRDKRKGIACCSVYYIKAFKLYFPDENSFF